MNKQLVCVASVLAFVAGATEASAATWHPASECFTLGGGLSYTNDNLTVGNATGGNVTVVCPVPVVDGVVNHYTVATSPAVSCSLCEIGLDMTVAGCWTGSAYYACESSWPWYYCYNFSWSASKSVVAALECVLPNTAELVGFSQY